MFFLNFGIEDVLKKLLHGPEQKYRVWLKSETNTQKGRQSQARKVRKKNDDENNEKTKKEKDKKSSHESYSKTKGNDRIFCAEVSGHKFK